jgi:hypothetical protein
VRLAHTLTPLAVSSVYFTISERGEARLGVEVRTQRWLRIYTVAHTNKCELTGLVVGAEYGQARAPEIGNRQTDERKSD